MTHTRTVKLRTRYNKFYTLTVKEQTEEFISGFDKFGLFVKIPMSDIIACEPCGEVSHG